METDLDSSLQQYKEQLHQVEDALKVTTDAEERTALTSLKNDLQELVDLTLQTINAQNDEEASETTETTEPSDPPIIDKEMALFMEEIKKLDSAATEAEDCDNDELFQDKLKQIQDELQAMIGKKCSAPHCHAWGTKSYHNAMICGVDDSNEYALTDIKDFKLRVLFIYPTHQEMVPCSYYLEGECRFDADKCRFSHGELVPFGELKEYEEPDFTKLLRNCVVLAKLPDKIWHKGRVLCSNFIEKTCRVRLDVQRKEVDCDFENLFPIFHDEDLSSGSSDSDTDSEETDEETIMRNARLIQQSLFTPAPDRALGEWEKYTKGIGSKLMQKMGYIVGTGLGSNGEGIIVPISAQILPPGRSLDHCMELREAANGDQDLFNVERTMAKEQKKQEALSAKMYERESNRTDIFSFLNETISANPQSSTENHNKKKSINDFKSHSTKNLNVQSVQIADEIRKKEKEIVKLKEAVNRHPATSEIHKKLQGQLSVKNQELNGLKSCESSLAKEQSLRKHKDKLSVF